MLNKFTFVSFLALTTIWVSTPVDAMDLPLAYSETSSHSFLTAQQRQDLFAKAVQGDQNAQDRLIDTFYLGLWSPLLDENPVRKLEFYLWDNIQERCNTNPKYAFFVLNLLSRKRIKENFPTLLPTVKTKADKGDPEYAHLEGWRWLKNLTTTKDHPYHTGHSIGNSLAWFRKAAEKGLARAQYDLAHNLSMYDAWFDYSHFVEITTAFQKAAKQGLVIADMEVGKILQRIIFRPKDNFSRDMQEFYTEENAELAVASLEKAAKAGFSEAQYNLGLICKKKEKLQEAVHWLTKARKAGWWVAARALEELGVVYEAKIPPAAKSSQQANSRRKITVDEMYQMGQKYFRGDGIEKDYKKSFRFFYYTKEAKPDSFYMLGLHYMNGFGVSKNKELAFQKFRRSARRGHQYAQFMLGIMYKYGHGIESNLAKSVFWYTQSKENNPDIKAFLRTHLQFSPPLPMSSGGDLQSAGNMVENWPDDELNRLIEKYAEHEKNPNDILFPGISKEILQTLTYLKNNINLIRKEADYKIILASYMSPQFKNSLSSNKKHTFLTSYQIEDQNYVIFSKATQGLDNVSRTPQEERLDNFPRQPLRATEDLDNCLIKGKDAIESKLNKKLKAITDRQEAIASFSTLFSNLMRDDSDGDGEDEEEEEDPSEALAQVVEQTWRTAQVRIEEDKATLQNILKKTKQSIFARGLKNQKDFLEEHPIYKE